MVRHRLCVVPHTHWDREWYRTHEAFRHRLVELLDALLPRLEQDEGFRHFTLDGQTIVVDDYLEVRPEARERIAKLVASGRLLVGPWTVLPDEWLVSGEALIRNLRAGLARAEALGGSMELGYVPDQFGHVGQLPQIFVGMGFDTAVLWRGVGAGLDETLFTWEAPDGSAVRAVHLLRGYGNGSHLPRDPRALADRLRGERDALARRSRVPSLLVMNGSDHLAPDPDLPERLAAAAAELGEEVELEIASLPAYAAALRREAPAELPRHRGELRSGLRAPLLAGCASARAAQKRADTALDRVLTRYLEPLSAWLSLLPGPGPGADCGRLAWLWRRVLENHPHDSICGCSVDAVHDQIDARLAAAGEAARAELARVTGALAARLAGVGEGGDPLAVWSPHAAGRAEACGELELECGADALEGVGAEPAVHVRDAAGRRIPACAEVVRAGHLYADHRVPARVAAALVRGFPPEFFGQPVAGVRRRDEDGLAVLEIWLGDDPPAPAVRDWETAREALAAELEARGERPTAFRPCRRPRVRLRFCDDWPGHGLRRYAVHPGATRGAEPRVRAESRGDGARLENEHWRIDVAGDGTVRCTHRGRGVVLEDAIRIASEGDRGDTYTFDPVPGASVVERPASARVVARQLSAERGEVVIDAVYRVPVGLGPARDTRSDASVELPVRLGVALLAGLDRVELDVRLENTARDQRLRLFVRAPEEAERFEVESAFEIAARPVDPPADASGGERPAEAPDAATPQRHFATWRGAHHALTVANRGAAEVAAHRAPGGGSLAVTLLRAVGWLSRGDLARRPLHAGPALETPGAQVPGPHHVELAFRLHDPDDPQRVAEAHRYAAPPLAFGGGAADPAPLRDGDRLLELDDPEVVVSAVEPRPDGAPWVRVWNASGQERRVALRVAGETPREVLDLRGRPAAAAGATRPAGEADTELRDGRLRLPPWRIATLR